MAVLALDHVNIRTADVPGTVRFLHALLDLRAEVAPGAASIDQGCWMYDAGERPILHIGPAAGRYPSDPAMPFAPERGSGSVHHVALECSDCEAMIARIEASGTSYVCNDIPQIGLRQLFVKEVNGVLLELNFRTE